MKKTREISEAEKEAKAEKKRLKKEAERKTKEEKDKVLAKLSNDR